MQLCQTRSSCRLINAYYTLIALFEKAYYLSYFSLDMSFRSVAFKRRFKRVKVPDAATEKGPRMVLELVNVEFL